MDSKKLAMWPFEVEQLINPVAVRLPALMKVHLMFHVSLDQASD